MREEMKYNLMKECQRILQMTEEMSQMVRRTSNDVEEACSSQYFSKEEKRYFQQMYEAYDDFRRKLNQGYEECEQCVSLLRRIED